jgi:hypothetical protein
MNNKKLTPEEADKAVVDVIRAIFKMSPLYANDPKCTLRSDADRFAVEGYGDRWREIHRKVL